MYNYDNVHLLSREKRSLFSFHFHKRKPENKIKCYYELYFKYKFIKQNYTGEKDEYGCDIFDGTYSISDNYLRYKIYLRKKRIVNLPNWLAILISLISLSISIATLLWQLELILK